MSEAEKKDVQEIIAMKIQVSKDDWKKEMEMLKEDLDAEKHEVKTRDARLRDLDETMLYFLKKWEDQLTNRYTSNFPKEQQNMNASQSRAYRSIYH